MTVAQPLLRVERLVAGYEPGVPIVDGVSLEADGGEIVIILGPNGAGKSTAIKAVAGLVPIASGQILLAGHDLANQPAHRRVHSGLAFVPQTENVFATLTVQDNLRLAAQAIDSARRPAQIARAFDFFPDLARQRRLAAGRLSGGQRQMLAVARALLTAPRLLLLDEPSAGLSPKAVADLLRTLVTIRAAGVGVLLVEQNVRAALSIADRVYVLVEGRNRLQGTPRELAADPGFVSLYIGGATPTAVGAAS